MDQAGTSSFCLFTQASPLRQRNGSVAWDLRPVPVSESGASNHPEKEVVFYHEIEHTVMLGHGGFGDWNSTYLSMERS